MALELINVSYKGHAIYAGVDDLTGQTDRPFTQFVVWIALAKSIRKAKTRGQRAATLTVREYAYRLKRWFDFIEDWNAVAGEHEKISWRTAQKKHMVYLSDKLREAGTTAQTRNGLRIVWEMFYEEFCPFMGYSHLMIGLSEIVEENARRIKKSLGKEPENEAKTFRVLSPEDISLLLANFEDVVFSCISYLMYASGLRIGGVLQVPYPDTDKNNPYITSPILIARDYGMSDNFFTFKYVNKGHEQVGDFEECDMPFYAWEEIWEVYRPLQEERLALWRDSMVRSTGRKSRANLYPKSFWLNKNGKEIVPIDVWKAFRCATKKVRSCHRGSFPDVVPHMLRHSYATWMVVDFLKKGNMPLDPDNEASIQFIHQYLQEQLGHRQISTTIKYMKTALRVVKRRWLPRVRLSTDEFIENEEQNTHDDHSVDFHGLVNSLKTKLAKRQQIEELS